MKSWQCRQSLSAELLCLSRHRSEVVVTRFNVVITLILAASAPLASSEQANMSDSLDPATVIEMRRQGFKDMGAAFKGVRDQFRRPKPVMVMISEYTKPLVRYSKEPVLKTWFPEGSGPGQGVETDALTVIWEKPDEFSARWEDYITAVEALQIAVKSRDLNATREQARKVGDTCTSCHKTFRAEIDE